MVALARKAQQQYQATHDQKSVDNICRAAAKVIYENAEVLSREAVDETGMGYTKIRYPSVKVNQRVYGTICTIKSLSVSSVSTTAPA